MTAFTVEWDTEAENQLADIWLRSSDPNGVTQAQATADRMLAQNPLGCGTEHHEGLRYLIVEPLVVWYSADTVRRIVRVDGVALAAV
jgi:plasmid stabilization system protein ParE